MNQNLKIKISDVPRPLRPAVAAKDEVAISGIQKQGDIPRKNERKNDEFCELDEVRGQLEETRSVMEIRINAKTKELRDQAEDLEKQIKERTGELQKKIEESENSRMALMNMLQDMEDLRRRAEEEKEKPLAIITNFTDGLMLFDSVDRLALVNSQMGLFFGVGKEDAKRIIGKKIADFGEVVGFKPLVDLLGGDLTKIARKELFISEKAVFEVSLLEISGQRNKVGVLLIVHDISREKMVERMKTEFVSIAAHQLRTPISAIKWTLRMILDGDLGPITEEQREFLEKTYKSNERMINLINDLLNVTRIEEGRHLYNIVAADMTVLVQSLIVNYADIAKQKNLALDYEGPVEIIPQVKIDVEKMKLVVSNLIENALKYTPAGGKISVSIGQKDDGVLVTVRDTGMGISAEQTDRIFTKYFRASNAVRMETEGTGL
jgi:signal transduction histidine kinase